MRVTPRIWIGLAIYLGYLAVIAIVTILGGVPFPEIGKSAETTLKGAVLPLGVAAVLLIVTTTALGWWRPALFDRQRSQYRWPIIAPAVMAVAAVLNLIGTDWSKFDATFLGSLIALGVLVGFCEELMARGLLLTALRSSLREGWVWFLTSALFGLMHMLNVVLGAPVQGTISQVALAFASGTAFYIARRVTGSLVWAMVLHGLWDTSVFAVGFAPKELSIAPLLVFVVAALSLASVYWVIKGANEKLGAGDSAPAAVPV